MNGTQRKILAVIKRMVIDRGYPPSMREMCVETGIKSTATIHRALEVLVDEGYITKGPQGSARSLRIVEEGDR